MYTNLEPHPLPETLLPTYTKTKLARVAITFTFLHPQYTMLADTYLSGGELVDDTRRNAIDSGVALVYERPDFGYLQMTNIDMPLSVNYREKIPTTSLERSDHGAITRGRDSASRTGATLAQLDADGYKQSRAATARPHTKRRQFADQK